jgi:ribulose-5-phosphate 4-epimerase/fuculose-1-phosphate aldolase
MSDSEAGLSPLPCYSLTSPPLSSFYEDHGLAPFGGIALSKHEEGEHIAQALGQGKACILQNHGHLTVAKTVDAATFLFGAFDRCIQAQLMADAAAAGRAARGEEKGSKTIWASEEVARYTRDAYNDEMAYIMFQSGFQDVVRASQGELQATVAGEMPRV